jgi:hypothetical protein
MFKIWYMTIILPNLLFSAVHMMQVFVYEKMLRGTVITLRTEMSLSGNEKNPALLLSDVHKRTSTPDCPSFGSMERSVQDNPAVRVPSSFFIIQIIKDYVYYVAEHIISLKKYYFFSLIQFITKNHVLFR